MMTEYATLEQARENWRLDPSTWTRIRNVIVFAALISWVGVIAGYFTDPERLFPSYLTGFMAPTVILLGCLFFIMVMFLTGSAWSVTVRRFFETMAATIPVAAILILPVLFGIHHLYEWSHEAVVAKDHILQGKHAWLNPQAFTIRAFICIAIWSLWSLRIYSNSVKQDVTHSAAQMDSSSRWSAPGLLVVFLSVSVAAFDWVMSLQPHWYSTIFGIYVYAGGGLGCMAAVTLICLAFRKYGRLEKSITIEHYHDLGKWMFALTIFWTYIAFSQYLLIWYANLAEETVFFEARFTGSWKWMSLLLLVGHFIVPFFVLLPQGAKRNLKLLAGMSIWIVFICYIDLYWMILPVFNKDGVHFHWLDFVCWLAVTSTYAFFFWWRLGKHSLIPEGDLRLEQSLTHINI